MEYLKIDDLEIKKVQKIQFKRNPIWSPKTGRAVSGKMRGDIVAQKYAISVVLTPLTDEEAASFDAAILPDFFNVTFKSPSTGKMVTKMMYASSPTYPVYSYVDGLPRYVGVEVELTEQ